MQGHRKSSLTTLPENMSFDHGSTSSEAGIDSQMPWSNNMQTSSHNRLPEYMISSNETDIQYLHPLGQEALNSEWILGETSSTAPHNQLDHNERKRERAWYDPSDILSSQNIDANANGNQILTQDLNVGSGFGDDHEDDDDACQIVERPNTYISIGSSNEQITSVNNSSDLPFGSNEYAMEESGDRLDFDGRRVSCKRKALHVGSSSGAGSSNSTSTPTQNGVIRPPEPRLRLGVGGPVLPNPFSSGSSRRNLRLRINGSRQQNHQVPSNLFLPEGDPVLPHVSSSQHLFDLNPPENVSLHVQSGLLQHVPSRSSQSRWSGPSSSGTNNLSDPMPYEEPTSRSIPRSIFSEHPMFVPSNETGSSSQQPTNWNLGGNNDNNNNNIAGNVGSSSGAGPGWSNRARAQYPRRLSEIVRRSLLTSAGIESGGQSNSQGVRSSSSIASGLVNHGRQLSNLRSGLLSERQHVDGALGLPYSLRSLAAAGEGRASIMSEIRHVLDLMRRGEGLRFEDVMILDHSVLFGMADRHDRHRDMRLDVDNMSYEELLALEERIGNVCTGLNEETIISRLKQRKYINKGAENEAETEPCSICREEYNEGEDLGTLECGHDFHKECIKQWLMHKNLCPICKTTGLTT